MVFSWFWKGRGQKEGANLLLIRQAYKCQVPNWSVFDLVLGRNMTCSEVWLSIFGSAITHLKLCVSLTIFFLKCPHLARLEDLIILPVYSSS